MRGTSNGNATGSAADHRARRAYLVAEYGWPADGDRPGLVCCYRCGVPLLQDEDPEAPGQSVTVDRIIPGAEGGRYVRANIRPCCGPCNSETGGAIGGARTALARSSRAHTEQTRGPADVKQPRSHGSLTPTGETPGRGTHESTHATHAAGAHTFRPPPKGGTCALPPGEGP